jgi:hypothetical protein
MNVQEAYDRITYRGDSLEPAPGEHNLRALTAEVVSRLPDEVREWLLDETTHIFIGGHGQLGEYFDLYFQPEEASSGYLRVRVIFLSEQLMRLPRDEAQWTIAHEIAHSHLEHTGAGRTAECNADSLAESWGFTEPPGRGADRARYPDDQSR